MTDPKPVAFEKIAPPGDEAGRKRREDHLRRTVAIAKATGLPIPSAEQVVSREDGSMPPPEAPPLTFDQRTEKLRKAAARARKRGTSISQAEAELEAQKGAA